ncbi:PREDICTED: APC membrane recruitment protein 2 [Cyprinodon variegatus]|uniref:APC membrane recruitment protein 2 n=1 Tax=Cyprinodon variegatus TaxID=28743 RepID=UPI00074289F6|nr:PREDICTED: APC membrane recruitment protein 2 [Cyprinodon variegatus]
MEVQSDCVEPHVAPQCDTQPAGKINKAAFKLFGKRRTGSGMASFFSFRNKGTANGGNNGNSENGNSLNGNSSAASAELVRSKTHDGLSGSNSDAMGQRGEGLTSLEAGPVRSLSKSLSFFSFLRRGSFRTSENGGAGIVRRGRGLKGFFSSMRWRRKEKTNEAEGEEVGSKKERDMEAAESENMKDITLTLEPPPHHHQEDCENAETGSNLHGSDTPTTSVTMTPTHCVAMPGPSGEPDSPIPYTPTDSPLRQSIQKAKASVSSLTPSLITPPLDRCSMGDQPSEPSVDRLCSILFTDVTSLKSFDSLTGCGDIIADAEEEGPGGNGGSGTSSSSSGGGGGSLGASVGRTIGISSATTHASPTKPSLPPQITQPMYSVAQSSTPVCLPARTRVPPPPTQHPPGSGVVAYMGGGEEMASPEGVDDADMQGLWHMLPSAGESSPSLPHQYQPSCSTLTSTYPPRTTSPSTHRPSTQRSADRKAPVKALGLSKIPVVGGAGSWAGKPPLPHAHGRHTVSPGEKELLSDEGYWDTPSATPTATPDESGVQRNQKIALSRDSCSGDHLYDLYTDPEEGEDQRRDDDLNSTPSPSADFKMSPTSQKSPISTSSSSSFQSLKGSTSLPRDSKIPVSTRQTSPPHSVSQSALSSVLEAETPLPKTQAPQPTRTRIPVSKVPVRRSGNKPANTTGGAISKK